MTDQTTVTPTAAPAVEVSTDPKPSRLKSFTTNHPRIVHVAQLTAAGLALVGATSVAKNMQHNKEKVAEALDHAKQAGDALSDSVVTSTDTEA